MYSNDDDRQREEQRRRDDDAAYARREQEQRNHAEANARRDQQDREWDEQRQQKRADDERHDREWEDWHKRQAGGGGYAPHSPSPSQSSSSQATSVSGGSSDGGLIGLAMLLLLLAAPPFLAYAALDELVRKFPGYAVNPSFAGQVAGVFVQTLRGEWALELHKLLKTSWRFNAYLPLFLYAVGIWVTLGATPWFVRQMFRIHAAVGLAVTLALVSVIGFYFYVSWYFSP